jgi:hypothetical protein
VDTDVLDETSLNRVVGGTAADVAKETDKVEIAHRTAVALGREEHVEVAARSALEQEVALELARCDVLFGCTDNLASRRLLNRLALQYFMDTVNLSVFRRYSCGGVSTRFCLQVGMIPGCEQSFGPRQGILGVSSGVMERCRSQSLQRRGRARTLPAGSTRRRALGCVPRRWTDTSPRRRA